MPNVMAALPNIRGALCGRDIVVLTSFFPIVDTCLSCEDIARQILCDGAQMAIFGNFCVLYIQRAARSTFQTCILNLH